MNENSAQEIIDFINSMYHEQIPGPVKFIVKRKVKKLKNSTLMIFLNPLELALLKN